MTNGVKRTKWQQEQGGMPVVGDVHFNSKGEIMDYKAVAKGLGWFSIALGVVELAAPGRLAKALDVNKGLVRAFGMREVVAGVGLLAAPAHSGMVWNRVAGDAMDLTALGMALDGLRKQEGLGRDCLCRRRDPARLMDRARPWPYHRQILPGQGMKPGTSAASSTRVCKHIVQEAQTV